MARAKILIADNDNDFLETRREFLEREGYAVVTASSPIDAQKKLQEGNIDLAIVDVRLLNDDDEKDISGLEFAKSVADAIPVIILTGYSSTEYMRQALRLQINGTRIAQDFISKQDGPMALLSAIHRGLKITKERKTTVDYKRDLVLLDVSEQMRQDYELARQQARWIGWARLGLIVGGALIFLTGIITVILGYRDVGIIGTIGGLIAGTLGRLMDKPAEDANRRLEQFHKELLLILKRELQRKEK